MSETVDYNGDTLSGAVFSGDGTNLVNPAAFYGQSDVQTFQGPGTPVTTGGTFTWVRPTVGSQVLIECWGGGGGGGLNPPTNTPGPAVCGGGGGGYSSNIFPMSIFPASGATVVVGAGGAAGTAPTYVGKQGGNTTVSLIGPGVTIITAYSGGGGGTTGNTGGGGGGGMAGAGVPGGPGTNAGGAQGGGTGSPGGPAVVFSPATNGVIFGGGGGGGVSSGGGTGVNGGSSVYGGGGGGGYSGGVFGPSIFGGNGGNNSPALPAPSEGQIPGGGGAKNSVGASGKVRITVF